MQVTIKTFIGGGFSKNISTAVTEAENAFKIWKMGEGKLLKITHLSTSIVPGEATIAFAITILYEG
ncbi:MAG TPA: hypothetical protein VLA04_00325 [Verrucomicrobiae bacterium]|nr:hypothetical protein [Verrucomicrobiae bacterium]